MSLGSKKSKTVPLTRKELAELAGLERKSGWGGRFAPDKKVLERLAKLRERRDGNSGK